MSLRVSPERVWTYEDYRRLPDDGNRYEVIDGKLFMSPSPSPYHQMLSQGLFAALEPLERQGSGRRFLAPVDVLLPGATPVIPDLVYIRADQAQLVTERAIEGVPELLVEVLSPGTAAYDRTVKLNKYASAGVPHYWMLDRVSRTLAEGANSPPASLILFRLEGGTYRLEASLGPGDCHEPPGFPGVSLDMDGCFREFPWAREQLECPWPR